MRARTWALAAILSVGLAASTQAQEPDLSSEDREARALYEAGVEALRSGRYANALDYFERSYELSGRPELLYNVGVAADRMRRDDLALQSFERFLEEFPDAPNREDVAARIAALRASREGGGAQDATPEPTPAPASDPTGWVLVGVGGALAVAGAVLWGVGAADAATVENARDGVRWETLSGPYERAPILSVTGAVSLGVGAGLAAIGLAVALSGGGAESETEVAIGPGGLVVRGRW